MPNNELQKRLLEYAYNKQKKEKVLKFRLGDVFEDFKGIHKDNIVRNLKILVENGMLYTSGEFMQNCKLGFCEYDYSLELKVSKEGYDSFEVKEKSVFGNILKKFKN